MSESVSQGAAQVQCLSWSKTVSTGSKGRDTEILSKKDKKTRISDSWCRDKTSMRRPPCLSGCPSNIMLSCCFIQSPGKTCLELKDWSTLPRKNGMKDGTF